jgi:hypothetical protein
VSSTWCRTRRAALRRLDELAPGSDVPEEQVAALRMLFEGRIARIEATTEQARTGSSARSRPAAFWRVAAELLAVERRTLAERAGSAQVSRRVADRAEHDLDIEEDELLGPTGAVG